MARPSEAITEAVAQLMPPSRSSGWKEPATHGRRRGECAPGAAGRIRYAGTPLPS